MQLPFGRKKAADEPEVKEKSEPSLADIELPEGATTVLVVGLDSKINPFIRSLGPVSPAQLALVNSYMTGLVMAQWQELFNKKTENPPSEA